MDCWRVVYGFIGPYANCYKFKEVLIQLYHSLVEPYMTYCSLIFGCAFDSLILPLEIAQRKCIRVVCSANTRCSSGPLFISLETLKFRDIYKYQLGIYMYKNPQIGTPSNAIHSYQTRTSFLIPAFQRLLLTQRQSVSFQGPSLWNIIPSDIKDAPSLRNFKYKLKQYLILKYSSR